jgi:hypothetical protein
MEVSRIVKSINPTDNIPYRSIANVTITLSAAVGAFIHLSIVDVRRAWDMRYCSWSRQYATSLKVAGSILVESTDF